jgi:hypothetical protein
MKTIHELYYAAVEADDMWHNELTRMFKKDACNVRYTKQGQGSPNSLLNDLYLAHRVACDAWASAVQEKERAIAK